jgi:type IV pilus assembly protein PilB
MKRDLLDSKEFDELLSESPSDAGISTIEITEADTSSELSDLWRPDEAHQQEAPKDYEEELCAQGHVTVEQLEQARTIHQKTPRKRLGQILLEMGMVREADLLACLAKQYDLPFIRVDREMVDPKTLEKLDRGFIETHNVLPIHMENGKLVVAMMDPANVFLLDEIQRKTGMQLSVKVCPSEDIKAILGSMQESEGGKDDFAVDDLIKNIEEDDVEVVNTEEEDITDLERVAGESPIIKFVNFLIFNGVKEGASDIHIEPGDKKLRIRYRIDGVLFEMMSPPHNMHAPVVSRIKIMANMDIAERRLPQDGRIRVVINKRNVDMRVSTLPTSYGEKVVIRILDTGSAQMSLQQLGMDSNCLAIMEHQIAQPHGIILVTGPTGSGKSTTLYGALRTIDSNRINISTVEDPVEYQLDGISQVQVHERIGMTFSAALRSLLRQDPDVIMVGEIRDDETARIAVQASLTGHLVLSTLHTNDAPSSITRLINIGVEPYLIAASTNLVLAQRLVRRICKHCKKAYEAQPEEASYIELFGFAADDLFKGEGCDRCRFTGFLGRVGLYELLVVDDTYRDIITHDPTVTELRRLCKERGMVTLREDGFHKAQGGLTTIDEVMRVTECTV